MPASAADKLTIASVVGSIIVFGALLSYYEFVYQPMIPPPHKSVTLSGGVGTVPVTIVPGATTKTNHSFIPDSIALTIGVNNSVVFYNNDSVSGGVAHEVAGRGGSFHTGVLDYEKSSGAIVFSTPGVYEYYCEFHPTMTGKVVVRAS